MPYSKMIEAYENEIKVLEVWLMDLQAETNRAHEDIFSSRLLLLEEELSSLKIVLRRLLKKQEGLGADP